ncbi:MAG: hypothetical protein ACK452_11930, partial [Bacteroidota bacterium]
MNLKCFKLLSVTILVLNTIILPAQTKDGEKVILTIDNKPITKSEFEAVFFKNNPKKIIDTSNSVEKYM